MSSLIVSAKNMGKKFTDDPEINLPKYPRFIPEILALPFGQQGLIFEGALGSQVITGKGARSFMPRLIKALDGSKTIFEIQNIFSKIPADSVTNAIILLYTRGLLEDGAPINELPQNADLDAFVGRFVDATRVNKNRSEAKDRLAHARVGIIGSTQVQEQMHDSLSDCGFGQLFSIDTIDDITTDIDVVVGCFNSYNDDVRTFSRDCYEKGVALFCNYIGENEALIGPLVVPNQSACVECAANQCSPSSNKAPSIENQSFWMGVIALNVFHLISRVGPFKLYNTVRIYGENTSGKYYKKRKLSRLPGCSTCGLDHAKANTSPEKLIYWKLHNAAHGLACKSLRNPKDHQMHYAAVNVNLTEKVPDKIYGAHSQTLDIGLAFDNSPCWSKQGRNNSPLQLNRDTLTTLLRYSVGYQKSDSLLRRIAPSAGGLGTIEMYLCLRDVPDIEDGIYRYFGVHHTLERINHIDDELLAGALGITNDALATVTVFGVANMVKIRQKYDRLAFRLMAIDAGVTRQITGDIADSLGLATFEYVDTRDKVVNQILQLPSAGNARAIAFSIGFDSHDRINSNDTNMHHYYLPDQLIELTSSRMLFEETKPQVAHDKYALVDLPESTSMRDLLLSRRSVRSFMNKPLSLEAISTIVAASFSVNSERSDRGGLPLEMKIWLIVKDFDNECGNRLMRWCGETRSLLTVSTNLPSSKIENMTIQPAFAQASANLFVTGNFEQATSKYSGRGYRELLSRAGSMMLRAQLTASSLNVDACMWGGITEESWGELLQIDRYTDCPLFSCSLGYKAND